MGCIATAFRYLEVACKFQKQKQDLWLPAIETQDLQIRKIGSNAKFRQKDYLLTLMILIGDLMKVSILNKGVRE